MKGAVPYNEVAPMGHPFQLRTQGFAYHYNAYGDALEDFHVLLSEEPLEVELFQLGEYAPGKKDWHLVSLGNPCGGRSQHPWVNLFAGRTLSPLFFLTPASRDWITGRGWPCPPDATGWTWAAETNEAVADPEPPIEVPAKLRTEFDSFEELAEEWVRHERCRVDTETLARRLNGGWDLVRAMTTPYDARIKDERRWIERSQI